MRLFTFYATNLKAKNSNLNHFCSIFKIVWWPSKLLPYPQIAIFYRCLLHDPPFQLVRDSMPHGQLVHTLTHGIFLWIENTKYIFPYEQLVLAEYAISIEAIVYIVLKSLLQTGPQASTFPRAQRSLSPIVSVCSSISDSANLYDPTGSWSTLWPTSFFPVSPLWWHSTRPCDVTSSHFKMRLRCTIFSCGASFSIRWTADARSIPR